MSTSKTKRHTNPKMGAPDYKLPPLCEMAYPNKPYEHMVSLLFRRPFKGTRLDCEDPGEERPRENDITRMNALKIMGRNVDTRSIDVLIILMRALRTFDAEMAQAQLMAAESALVESSERDVGRIMDHNLHLKYTILKPLVGGDVLARNCMSGISFETLVHHPQLSHIFITSPKFSFYCCYAPSRPRGAPNRPRSAPDAPLTMRLLDPLIQINALRPWDGSSSLQDYLNERLPLDKVSHEEITYYPYVGRPPFLRIEYTLALTDKRNTFQSMRTVRLEGETMWETGKDTFGCGRPSTLYVLFAIVRCASDAWNDDIRLYYKSGGEIVPYLQMVECTAINEYRKRQKRWSVEEPGKFMLFYFRLEADDALEAESEIRSKTVSEYEPRVWETDPASGQDGEQAPMKGLVPPRNHNPEVDIVYLGRKTCVSSIAAFLRKDIEIQRVAIEGQLSQPYDRCCTWEASDTLGIQRGEGAIGGITGLQALHGYDPDVLEGNTSWPGCKGLKDLFIIMDQWIWRDETQSIGLSSKLYDASTHQQREWKVNVTRELARIESDNGGLGSVGQNKWTGACKPTIQMMSLYPFAHCGKKTMTFNADRTDPYIKDMARSIYCAAWDTSTADVSVEVEFDQRYPADRATCWELSSLEEYEITIHESPDQIERAEELIEAGIVNILVPYMEIRE